MEWDASYLEALQDFAKNDVSDNEVLSEDFVSLTSKVTVFSALLGKMADRDAVILSILIQKYPTGAWTFIDWDFVCAAWGKLPRSSIDVVISRLREAGIILRTRLNIPGKVYAYKIDFAKVFEVAGLQRVVPKDAPRVPVVYFEDHTIKGERQKFLERVIGTITYMDTLHDCFADYILDTVDFVARETAFNWNVDTEHPNNKLPRIKYSNLLCQYLMNRYASSDGSRFGVSYLYFDLVYFMICAGLHKKKAYRTANKRELNILLMKCRELFRYVEKHRGEPRVDIYIDWAVLERGIDSIEDVLKMSNVREFCSSNY